MFAPHVRLAIVDGDELRCPDPPVRFGDTIWEEEVQGFPLPLLALRFDQGLVLLASTPRAASAQAYWPAAGRSVPPAVPLPAMTHLAGVALSSMDLVFSSGSLVFSESDALGGDLRFALAGPPAGVTLCTLGLPCTLRLDARPDTAVLIAHAGSCGSRFVLPHVLYGWTNPSIARGGKYALGVGISGGPGSYKLCWGPAPGNPLELLVEAGELVIAGPEQQHAACYLSIPCGIQMTGSGLGWSHQIHIVWFGKECGASGPDATAVFRGMTNPVGLSAGSIERGTFDEFDLGLAGGGTRNVYPLCWSYYPSTLADFVVNVGTFTLRGPDEDSLEAACWIGALCSIKLSGLNLAVTNALLVAESGRCGTIVPLLHFYAVRHDVRQPTPRLRRLGPRQVG